MTLLNEKLKVIAGMAQIVVINPNSTSEDYNRICTMLLESLDALREAYVKVVLDSIDQMQEMDNILESLKK